MSWNINVEKKLDEVITELELPENSLYLDINYKRGTEEINSYSVCIYEPDYPIIRKNVKEPSRNAIVMNIKEGTKELEAILDLVEYGDVEIKTHKTKKLKSDPQKIHVFFRKDDDEFIGFVERHVRYCVSNYTSKASSFGCCNRFMECSDMKKCVHENKLYSKACMYRMHLDRGEIFYGKNKNI